MTSEDEVSRYRALSREFPATDWLEPLHRLDHVQGLVAAFQEGVGSYDGRFEYVERRITERTQALRTFAESLEPSYSPVRALVVDQIRRSVAAAEGLRGGDESYTKAQIETHGLPSLAVTAHAHQVLATTPRVTNGVASVLADELAARIRAALHAFDISDWHVVIETNMSAKASVNGIRRRVRVREGEVFSARAADRLVVHEVGGHVLRWVNSQRQTEAWASVPLGDTTATEEGLAVCREAEFGLTDQEAMRTYAARCIAVDVASREGIMAVVAAVEPAVGLDQAAEIAVRVKRGLRDPNRPGGMTKDWGYLGGFLATDALRTSDPRAYDLLTAVKWSIEDLPTVRQLAEEGALHGPSVIPLASSFGLS